jgi:hypothetical protein
MVERYVFLKLRDDQATPTGRAEVRDEALRVLPSRPGVRGARVGLPADAAAEAAWDVVLVVSFDRVEDVAAYVDDPVHRAFVDGFLATRVVVRKVWNFDVPAAA